MSLTMLFGQLISAISSILMTANLENATQCLVGGVIIGAASSVMLAATGQITGISGILRSAAFSLKPTPWKTSFISGLFTGGVVMGTVAKKAVFGTALVAANGFSPVALLTSGYLVGLGTTLGSGCTSGHGVCGLPRFSQRSLVASMSFFATGVATQTVIQANERIRNMVTPGEEHLSQLDQVIAKISDLDLGTSVPIVGVTLASAFGVISYLNYRKMFADKSADEVEKQENRPQILALTYGTGVLFASGLAVSGMTIPSKVTNFLDIFNFGGNFNPCLIMVLAGAVGFNLVTFPRIMHLKKPLLTPSFHIPTLKDITAPLVVGSALFGVGWGMVGLCPGPALVGLAGGVDLVPWIAGLGIGSLSAPVFQKLLTQKR
jgi:uncharacterized membrane protein YedE/YeeE/predicted outer membrane lipoprotein